MSQELTRRGSLSLAVPSSRGDALAGKELLVSHEVWVACQVVAASLPRSIRFELRSEPCEHCVHADREKLRRELAALLHRAAALLRHPSGVLAVAVRVAPPEQEHEGVEPVAWIEVRLFGDREPPSASRELLANPHSSEASGEKCGLGGGGEGPECAMGGRPFRREHAGPSHLLLPPRARRRPQPRDELAAVAPLWESEPTEPIALSFGIDPSALELLRRLGHA